MRKLNTPEAIEARANAFHSPEAVAKRRAAALKGAETKRRKASLKASIQCQPVDMLAHTTPECPCCIDEHHTPRPSLATPYASSALRGALLRNVSVGVIMRLTDSEVNARILKMGEFLVKRQFDMYLNPRKYFSLAEVPEAVARMEGLPFRDAQQS